MAKGSAIMHEGIRNEVIAYLDLHGGYFSTYIFQNILNFVRKSNLEDSKIYD